MTKQRRRAMRIAAALAGGLLAGSGAVVADARGDYLAGFDVDGDGRVSESEYVAYLVRGFDDMDRNGDGELDAVEMPEGTYRGRSRFREALVSDLRRSFRRMDSNGDGHLDRAELTSPPR